MNRLLIAVLLGNLFSLACVAGIDIAVDIKDVRNDKGNILVSIFSSPDGFPSDYKQAAQLASVQASSNGVSVVFTNLASGTYAIAVCHDENADGQMNRKFYGPPKEGYGLFKAQKPRMGPPQFVDSAFDAGKSNMNVTVSITYPED